LRRVINPPIFRPSVDQKIAIKGKPQNKRETDETTREGQTPYSKKVRLDISDPDEAETDEETSKSDPALPMLTKALKSERENASRDAVPFLYRQSMEDRRWTM